MLKVVLPVFSSGLLFLVKRFHLYDLHLFRSQFLNLLSDPQH